MSDACADEIARDGISSKCGDGAAVGAAGWLRLAAAPSFAAMALFAGASGPPDLFCSAARHASPLSGMVPMYLLMCAVHLAPWLTLISSRRRGSVAGASRVPPPRPARLCRLRSRGGAE